MRGSLRKLLLGVVSVFVLLWAGVVTAEPLYKGVRVWDPGPFQVWSGIDNDDPSQRVLGVAGQTKGVKIAYPLQGFAPDITIENGVAKITFQGPTNSVRPIDPPILDDITYCTNIGPDFIVCYCQVCPGCECHYGGVVDDQPNSGWLDI